MKRTVLNYHYNRLLALFHKLQFRLNRNFLNGRFKELGKRQQYQLVKRLEKLKNQLARIENGIKYGGIALAAAAGLSLNPSETMAQFAASGSEFRVNTRTTNVQNAPKVAMDSDGDFVVTWASRGQDDPSEYGIYAQCFNAKGIATSAEFRVNTYTIGRQYQPVIAMEDNGDFVIAWTSSGEDGNSGGVYAQRFKSTGQSIGSRIQVNTYTTGNQYSPAVAMDSDGDFVITWSSPQGVSYDVYARRYDAAGAAVSSEFKVNTNDAGAQRFSTIAMDNDGDFVITWPNDGLDGDSYGIYGQRFNANGVAQGGEFRANTYTNNAQRYQSVVMDGDGDFVVVWTSSGGQDGNSDGIYAQRYNASGIVQGPEFRVNTYTTSSQLFPAITMDNAGNFVVAWESFNQDGNNKGIYTQRYNAAGIAKETEFQVNTYTTDDQQSAAIAMDNDGDFVIAWSSNGQDGSSTGIFAQRYEENFAPTDITLNPVAINENVAANTAIATLSTADPDNGNTFTYTFVAGTGDADNASFTIVDNKLQINTSPDFETKSSYSIRVRSTDQSGLFFEKVFTITVNDLNEAPNDISLNVSSIDEGVAANTEVATLSASDDDGGSFTFTLVSGTGDDDNASFSIVDDKLQINESPDFETKSSYSIRVRSTDQDELFFEKEFTITVTDENEVPTDITLSTSSIAENVTANTEVGAFTTTDQDAANTVTYSFTTGTGDADNASFTITDDKLQINASPDFETKSSYSIRVRSTDQDGLSFEKVFTITVTDENEAPSDITLSVSSIDEGVPANTEVATLSASDDDGGSFTFTLVSGTGDDDNASFTIVDDKLQISESPDFETKSSYSIRVSATDDNGLSIEKILVITINDVTETGLSEVNTFSASIQLYPNPAKGTVQMNLEGTIQVRMMDLSGHVVKQDWVSNKMINIEGIPSGIYMLEFTQNDKTGWKKLIIE